MKEQLRYYLELIMSNILTRQQAIDELMARVNNDWDIDTLINFANFHYKKILEQTTNEELESEYNIEFGIYDSENEEIKIVDTKASKLLLDKDIK